MRYFLFIILSFVVAAGYSASRLIDLREQAYLFPQVALRQIDSLQQKAQYPSYQLEYIRSCAYFRLSMFGRALDSAEKAYHSVEIKSDTVLYRRISMILAEASVFAFSLDKATRYIRKGKEYATSISDHVMLAGMLLSEGYLYRRLSLSKKAYECAFRAEKLLEGGKSETEIYYLSHTYGFLMMYYISDRKYAEAWQIGLERSKLLSRLPELRRDNQSGYLYSKMAFLAHMLGKEFEDEKYYELFLGTHFSKTLVERLEINDYLLTMKKYDQVIGNAQAYVREMDRRDTLNISYVRLLQQACVAYEAVGDYRKAYAVAKRRLSIQQAIRLNNERNYLLENTDLFNALAAREELEETEEKLRVQTIWLGVLTGILLLSLLALGGFMRKGGKMRIRIVELEKLRQVQQYLLKKGHDSGGATDGTGRPEEKAVEEEVEQAVPEVPRKGTLSRLSNEELFALFDKKVRQEKLYLDYSLGRDQYARVMGVDKNRFAGVLKEFGNTNLAAYLNSLRLEYAIELFHENPEWSISKIAEQSAIPNLSTFYRLFKDKYGMSPNLFRNKM